MSTATPPVVRPAAILLPKLAVAIQREKIFVKQKGKEEGKEMKTQSATLCHFNFRITVSFYLFCFPQARACADQVLSLR